MLEGLHGHVGHRSELKQQSAIAAAQDPHSSVTAEDAEQVMLNEAKASGAAAFQFDPNATAAEKAQQAKAVRSLGNGLPKLVRSAHCSLARTRGLERNTTAQSRNPRIRPGTVLVSLRSSKSLQHLTKSTGRRIYPCLRPASTH